MLFIKAYQILGLNTIFGRFSFGPQFFFFSFLFPKNEKAFSFLVITIISLTNTEYTADTLDADVANKIII